MSELREREIYYDDTATTRPRFAIVGFGVIGQAVADLLTPEELDLCVGVHVRPGRVVEAQARLGGRAPVLGSMKDGLTASPSMVVECAGHGALRDYGANSLHAGGHLIAVSSGALADPTLEMGPSSSYRATHRRVIIPAGGVVGIDGIAAARVGGLFEVLYEGRKPPRAWQGTPAETLLGLDRLTEAAAFFEGSARHSARNELGSGFCL